MIEIFPLADRYKLGFRHWFDLQIGNKDHIRWSLTWLNGWKWILRRIELITINFFPIRLKPVDGWRFHSGTNILNCLKTRIYCGIFHDLPALLLHYESEQHWEISITGGLLIFFHLISFFIILFFFDIFIIQNSVNIFIS